MKRANTAEQYSSVITPSERRRVVSLEADIAAIDRHRSFLCGERQALRNALWLRTNKK